MLAATIYLLCHICISLIVPFYDPIMIMLQYCLAVLVLLLIPMLFLFFAALIESLFFCLANCSLAYFPLPYFYGLVESSPLSHLATHKH